MKRILLALLAICCVVSCRYKDPTPLDCKYYDSMIFERHITFDDMVDDVMKYYGESAGSFDAMNELVETGQEVAKSYTVYGIRYWTTDHEGKRVLASGLVYFPETMKIQGVVEIVPVIKNRSSCGTVNQSIPEAIAGCTGYIMTAPDLLGCGEASQYPICYLMHDLVAKNSADLRKAAHEFLYNHRYISMGKNDYLFGYSLGGSGVLALARFYEKHPEYGIKVKELWLGAGAYFPPEAVETIVSWNSEGSVLVPNILWAQNQYDTLNLDFTKIFKGDLLENYEELITGNVSSASLRGRLGDVMDNYMDRSFFSKDNEDWMRCRATLQKMSVPLDFKPKYPIVLYHSAEDHSIPIAQSDSLYMYLKSVGADVDYKRAPEGEHHMVGFKIEGDLALHLYHLI